jgi:hypothetical protein
MTVIMFKSDLWIKIYGSLKVQALLPKPSHAHMEPTCIHVAPMWHPCSSKITYVATKKVNDMAPT